MFSTMFTVNSKPCDCLILQQLRINTFLLLKHQDNNERTKLSRRPSGRAAAGRDALRELCVTQCNTDSESLYDAVIEDGVLYKSLSYSEGQDDDSEINITKAAA